jgi:hypothetical protein
MFVHSKIETKIFFNFWYEYKGSLWSNLITEKLFRCHISHIKFFQNRKEDSINNLHCSYNLCLRETIATGSTIFLTS